MEIIEGFYNLKKDKRFRIEDERGVLRSEKHGSGTNLLSSSNLEFVASSR